jgi:hypothetical protein
MSGATCRLTASTCHLKVVNLSTISGSHAARVVEVVIASPIMFFRRQSAGGSPIGWHVRSRSCAVVAPDDRNFAHSLAQFVFLRTRRVRWQLICLYLINKLLISRQMSLSQTVEQHSGQESEVYPDCPGVLPMHLLAIKLE